MAFVFVMTFNYLGAWLSDWMTMGVDWVIGLIGSGLQAAGVRYSAPVTGSRRNFKRYWKRDRIFADNCYIVFLFVHSGRHRIYGEGCICNG